MAAVAPPAPPLAPDARLQGAPSPDPLVQDLRARLLGWYDAHAQARALPWRITPQARAAGARPDPYRVWLSEVMLQQTTSAHVAPYWTAFLERWPTVQALAAAPDAEVMGAWAGLGYYARARNLLACARAVAARGGAFPDNEAGLLALPGCGPYTAAAVAAIAFDRPANVVDGNVERVMARLYAVEAPVPAAKPELKRLAGALASPTRPGDWAQALMDLGATICRPRTPDCPRCPLALDCAGRAMGAPERFPIKAAKAARPRRHGVAFVLLRGGEVALAQRPPRGLLGGMPGLPTTHWSASAPSDAQATASALAAAAWREAGAVEHVFTHFPLTLEVLRAQAPPGGPPPEGLAWTPLDAALATLPTVFAKALRAALDRLV